MKLWRRAPFDFDAFYEAYSAAKDNKEAARMFFEVAAGYRRSSSWRGWHSVVLALVILFALFLWPTPFAYYQGPRREVLIRVNRITGNAAWIVPTLNR